MKTLNFLKTELKRIVLDYPKLSLKVKYSELYGKHIIDVEPKSQADGRIEDSLWEIMFKFIEEFPTESLTFSLKNNHTYEVENPDFTVEGSDSCQSLEGILSARNEEKPSFDISELAYVLTKHRYEDPHHLKKWNDDSLHIFRTFIDLISQLKEKKVAKILENATTINLASNEFVVEYSEQDVDLDPEGPVYLNIRKEDFKLQA